MKAFQKNVFSLLLFCATKDSTNAESARWLNELTFASKMLSWLRPCCHKQHVLTSHSAAPTLLSLYVLTRKKKAFVLSPRVCAVFSDGRQKPRIRQASVDVGNTHVRRPQTAGPSGSITVMDRIDACYWKLPHLCGMETDQRRSGWTTCPRLQFQRINFLLNYITSRPCSSALSCSSCESPTHNI